MSAATTPKAARAGANPRAAGANASNPRRVAFDVLRQVTGEDAYANLALAKRLAVSGLDARDAGLVTELVSGTCRLMGTYDRVIEEASGRALGSLQPAVVDLLRLGCHQLLGMRVKKYAAVGSTVDLARATVGQRVTGLVNAIMRKASARTLDEWTELIAAGEDEIGALAVRGHHPRWIVEAYADVLPRRQPADGALSEDLADAPRRGEFADVAFRDELAAALAANNVAPQPTLVLRPGLAELSDLEGAEPTRYSPFGATAGGVPADQPAVRDGRAGVQDEGSQLVAWALARTDAPDGPWLDMCAGPGGKAALLAGLASESGTWLLASEAQEHRARLVQQALSVYDRSLSRTPGAERPGPRRKAVTITADGTTPAWGRAFSRIMVDVPCSGLGALRRRPESRWRRRPEDVTALGDLQRALLRSALDSAVPGGVVAYVTCSPHRAETVEVVDDVLAERPGVARLRAADALPGVPDCAVGDDVQLWPQRHGTDAMYLALLRVPHAG
ncbi:MAG TPA: RsmB/NOP family class I SAM-dependent RNA methyltransferase [Arachnia sp.]|jgi:16S rRNA (cytosine967-C5)-methyltransferase|nr:RsmB/NOP family class I SAM-dependent RNA methyltransferase [Propionibacteriaceae bacterium]HOA28106.1 RsmB/NOP family class I SAM-dependent RNA methyltransferase [Arachnia sp.]HQD22165.1 RsmB/NOP family class I SAM-dependent RNA methyltransferase [Arachnia sp.]